MKVFIFELLLNIFSVFGTCDKICYRKEFEKHGKKYQISIYECGYVYDCILYDNNGKRLYYTEHRSKSNSSMLFSVLTDIVVDEYENGKEEEHHIIWK